LDEGFGNLVSCGHHWIQTGERILEDHGNADGPNLIEFSLRQAEKIGLPEPDVCVFGDNRSTGQQPDHSPAKHRLAAA
jgi:hypothetical protein